MTKIAVSELTRMRITYIDRGYESTCWVSGLSVRMRSMFLKDVLGPQAPGEYFQHLCEVRLEENRCVRPDHIFRGNASTNNAHWHQLRREAGLAWAPFSGRTHSEETTAKIRLGNKRKPPASEETRQRISRAKTGARFGKYETTVCTACGKTLAKRQLSQHQGSRQCR